jgi:hypothetical protein
MRSICCHYKVSSQLAQTLYSILEKGTTILAELVEPNFLHFHVFVTTPDYHLIVQVLLWLLEVLACFKKGSSMMLHAGNIG